MDTEFVFEPTDIIIFEKDKFESGIVYQNNKRELVVGFECFRSKTIDIEHETGNGFDSEYVIYGKEGKLKNFGFIKRVYRYKPNINKLPEFEDVTKPDLMEVVYEG